MSRIFTCFFALSGVACLGIAIGVIGNNVMEAQEMALEKTKKLAQHRVLTLFSSSSSSTSGKNNNNNKKRTSESDTETDEGTITTSASSVTGNNNNSDTADASPAEVVKSHPLWQLAIHFCLVLVILVIFAFCVASDPGIDGDEVNIFDALYYTIISK